MQRVPIKAAVKAEVSIRVSLRLLYFKAALCVIVISLKGLDWICKGALAFKALGFAVAYSFL